MIINKNGNNKTALSGLCDERLVHTPQSSTREADFTHPMQTEVEATCVADGFANVIPTP